MKVTYSYFLFILRTLKIITNSPIKARSKPGYSGASTKNQLQSIIIVSLRVIKISVSSGKKNCIIKSFIKIINVKYKLRSHDINNI